MLKFNKLMLIALIVVPHVQAAASSSSNTQSEKEVGAPSLLQQAFRTLVLQPGKFAEGFNNLNYNRELQSQLFVESVNNALGSRLGLRVSTSFDLPFKQTIFLADDFDGFSPNNSLLVLEAKDARGILQLQLMNLITGRIVWQGNGYFGGFSPDSSSVAIKVKNAYGNYETHLIDTATGKIMRQIAGWFLRFSPDGSSVAVHGKNAENRFITQFINTSTGAVTRQMNSRFPVFSPDGSLIALSVFNQTSHSDETQLINTATDEIMGQIAGRFSAFSPDGSLVAVRVQIADSRYITRFINTATGEIMSQLEGNFWGFSPDGSLVAIQDQNNAYQNRLVNPATGEVIRQISGIVGDFSPDGSLVAVSSSDGALGFETRLINTQTGEVERNIAGIFLAFSPDGAMLMSRFGADKLMLILTTVDFRRDLMNITDPQEQKFLLRAAQAWLDKKAYEVLSDDPVYLSVIKKIPYLSDPLLFEPIVSLQSIYTNVRKQLDDYALMVYDPDDQQFKDLTLRTYDVWHDLQKSQDAQADDSAIYNAFMTTLTPRSPAWIVLREQVGALTSNYTANRAQREAQQLQHQPALASQEAGFSAPSSSSASAASSSSEVRAADAPVTMRLFEDAAEYQP